MRAWRRHRVHSNMNRFALIGHPLAHSLSPEIHRAIMDSAGIAGTFELVDIAPADMGSRLPGLLRDFDGFNVTIPHKKAVIPFLSGKTLDLGYLYIPFLVFVVLGTVQHNGMEELQGVAAVFAQ